MFGYTCEECGQGKVEEKTIKNYETKIKGYPFVVPEASVGICDKCGAEHFAAEETKRWEVFFYKSMVESQVILSPANIKRVRKSIGLSMENFALLIGCTRQSLYNWERRDRARPQSRMADLLIKVVDKSYSEVNVDVLGFLVEEAQKLGIALEMPKRRKVTTGDLSPDEVRVRLPKVAVLGIGDGGCSTVNRMFRAPMPDITYVALNTDERALQQLDVPVRIQIGQKLTRGLGAGGDPIMGRKAAMESQDEIRRIVQASEMVFLIAAMGGGTGTGAAPVIGKICKKLGVLTVGLVSKPFTFEGAHRHSVAQGGVAKLINSLDTLIIVPNDGILVQAGEKVDMASAFAMIEETLALGVGTIGDLVTGPGVINLTFADLKAVLTGAGSASISVGVGRGQNRAVDATRAAIASPLLENSIGKAKGILFSVTGGSDLTLFEVNKAAEVIGKAVDPEANIIFGVVFDPRMKDEVRIVLIGTISSMDESHTIKADVADRILDQVFRGEALGVSSSIPAFLRRYQPEKEAWPH